MHGYEPTSILTPISPWSIKNKISNTKSLYVEKLTVELSDIVQMTVVNS